MSQELLTPSETYEKIAKYFYQDAIKSINPNDRCEICYRVRWFAKDRNQIKLCPNCFKEIYHG